MKTNELERIAKLAWNNFKIDSSNLEIYQNISWYIEDFKIKVNNNIFQNTLEGFITYFVTQMTDPLIYKSQSISKQRAQEYIRETVNLNLFYKTQAAYL
ncbi:MAG: hypothetical protein PHU40_12045 [Sulfurimonas sp.]|nr:hypothetical protein [Sulfurimonas sp.]